MLNPSPTKGVLKEALNRHVFEEPYLLNGSLKLYDYKYIFDEPLIELSNGMQVNTI